MNNGKFVIIDEKQYITKNITIYPEKENVFDFEILNNLNHNVACTINIRETNKDELPLVYSLKENNKSIKIVSGSCDNCLELYVPNTVVKKDRKNIYSLQWENMSNKSYDESECQLTITVETKPKKKMIIFWLILLLIVISLLSVFVWKKCSKKPTATLGEKDVNIDITPTPVVPTPGENLNTPNVEPTQQPAQQPTQSPIYIPIEIPIIIPTQIPIIKPSQTPTVYPSQEPTQQPTVQPTNEPTQNPTIKPSEQPTEKPEEPVNKEFYITSKNQQWTERLSIFDNTKYNNRPIIYPGIESTYYFEFTNNQDFDVECSIRFTETNNENIPIKYKLKENGRYIKGNSSTYVNYSELNTTGIVVPSNSKNVYELEWKWIDGGINDNSYGNVNKTVTYGIDIVIEAQERI